MDSDEDEQPPQLPPLKGQRLFVHVKKKIEIVERVQNAQRLNTGETIKGIANLEGVRPAQIRYWTKQILVLKAKAERRLSSKATVHRGRPSSFKKAVELVEWVLDLREEGMPVSIGMVILRASQLDNDFRRKKSMAKYSIIRRLLIANGIVIRAKTHESQRLPQEVMDEAKGFVNRIRPSANMPNRDKRFIINMDQTPVFFSMVPNNTLQQRGSRTVNVRASSGSTIRITAAVTVTAAGGRLPLLIVYKGKPNGRIARDFKDPTKGYPVDCFYACQDRAWMDKVVMLDWVDQVLKPYVETAPPGVVPLLFLDSYKCHLLTEVVGKIQDLGVEVQHIPGGCTGLTQPVDVGINKPLKNEIRHNWEKFMLEEGLLQDRTQPPTRQVVAKWCIDALKNMDEQVVKNSWLHGDYSFFPTDVAARSAAKAAAVVLPHLEMLTEDGDDEDDDEEDDALLTAII